MAENPHQSPKYLGAQDCSLEASMVGGEWMGQVSTEQKPDGTSTEMG